MPSYRIYKLSHDNHIFDVPDEIECASDQDAIAHAKAKLNGLDIEVWQGPRMVMRLNATDK
jgi:hypothetical protein